MTATPATIARTVIADQNQAAARRADAVRVAAHRADVAKRRSLPTRRAAAARHGYRGPLTRNELAEQTSRQFARAQMAAAIRHAR